MMGIFLAFDIMLFYVFFEVSLVPLFFLIGIWGGSQCRLAARKFFLYTLTGSMLTLLGVLGPGQFCYQHNGPARTDLFDSPPGDPGPWPAGDGGESWRNINCWCSCC